MGELLIVINKTNIFLYQSQILFEIDLRIKNTILNRNYALGFAVKVEMPKKRIFMSET